MSGALNRGKAPAGVVTLLGIGFSRGSVGPDSVFRNVGVGKAPGADVLGDAAGAGALVGAGDCAGVGAGALELGVGARLGCGVVTVVVVAQVLQPLGAAYVATPQLPVAQPPTPHGLEQGLLHGLEHAL